MTEVITEPAPAKINLALHVRARRPDGYHELETLFAFVEHGDTITLAPGPLSLTIGGPFAAGLSGEGDNLVTRAAMAFAGAFGTEPGGMFTLDKHLPVASGIGGGSADAAAALRALARLHGVATDDARLFDVAAALGSDVPACLIGRTAIGRGRGERLEPVDGPTGMPVLLLNPGVAVSTAAVFKAWDGADRGPMPQGDALTIALAGRNDLEPPALVLQPVIGEVLQSLNSLSGSSAKAGDPPRSGLGVQNFYPVQETLLGPGLRLGGTKGTEASGDAPILARMSGSGATCFALYDTERGRDAAATAIRTANPGWWCLETRLA